MTSGRFVSSARVVGFRFIAAAVAGAGAPNSQMPAAPLREVERQQILGISASTLYRRLRDYNLTKRQ
jgi:hypothetical protein